MPPSPLGRPSTDAYAPTPRFPGGRLYRAPLLAMLLALASLPPSRGGDWPQFGRDGTRNPVSPEARPPLDWDVASGRNVHWKARLGSIPQRPEGPPAP